MSIKAKTIYRICNLLGIITIIPFACHGHKLIGGVFVIGGIHRIHESAQIYTYERMGQVYKHLKPDILCIETQ